MRKQTADDLRKIREQEDMLQGNINRMCVTDDLSELDNMAFHAKKRIDTIQIINYKRLTESEIGIGETGEDGIPTIFIIPRNPTNGDIIKALFPNGKVVQTEKGCLGYEMFDGCWWNKPYKRGE